jgi:hypothetical protein
MAAMGGSNEVFTLSKAAMEFGPFLFAIVFIVLVPPYAYATLRKSYSVSQHDPERGNLLREGRTYFRSAWVFGMLLVICAVSWWVYLQNFTLIVSKNYEILYTGYITGLTKDDAFRTVPPEEPPFFVQTKENDALVYRFYYFSPVPITQPLDLTAHVSYVNLLVAQDSSQSADGVKGRGEPQVEFTLVPNQTIYKFVTDNSNRFMIVPPNYNVTPNK